MGKEDDNSLRSATDDGDPRGAGARSDDIADPAIYTLGFMGWMSPGGSFDLPPARPGVHEDGEHIEEVRLAQPDADTDALQARLNHLLAVAHDGAWGMDDAAGHAQAQEIAAFLQRAAEDWRLCALELRGQLARIGAAPVEGGTPGGALQRGWHNLRAALPGFDDAALLLACEQLQQDLLARLREGLHAPSPLHAHLDDAPVERTAPLLELERRAARRLGQIATVRACIAAESQQE